MSDFPFAGDDTAEADAGQRDRKAVLLAGGLAAVVLAGGAYYFMGSGDDSTATTASTTSSTRTVKSTRAATAAAAAAPVKVIPASASVEVGRNPFRALYVVPAPAVAPAAPAGVAGGTTAAGTPLTGSGGAVDPTVITPIVPAGPVAPVPVTYKLVLTSVSQKAKPTATFTVGARTYAVGVGTAFGPTKELKVVSFQTDPATERPTVTITMGEATLPDVEIGRPVYVM